MSAAAKIATALSRYGRDMTLRRRVGTTAAFTDVVVRGVQRGYKATELVGGIVQGDREITVSNKEIAAQSAYQGPPKKGDFVVVDGVQTTVQGVETKYLGTEILAHVLHVRG